MIKKLKPFSLVALIMAFCISAASAAGVRVRGEIVDIKANSYIIENASGQSITVTISEPTVLVYSNISLNDVDENAYVSVPSIAVNKDTWRALGVTVFPEPMRGLNEGFDTWDLTSESRMTNATVAKVLSRGGERVLTLSYGDEKQTVMVPETAPVTTFAPNPKRKLEKGNLVVIFADEENDKFSAKFVAVHEDGSLPPV